MTCKYGRDLSRPSFFEPIEMPKGALIQVGTTTRERDGRVLKQMKLRGPDGKPWGPVMTEQPMDTMFDIEIISVEPMKAPVGTIFFQDAHDYSKQIKDDPDVLP